MQKHLRFVIVLILFICHFANAQDEGPITKKARVVSNGNMVYFGIGSSFSVTGDYGAGFNAEAGFLKRRNRFLSAGAFLSYSGLKYNNSKGNNVFIEAGGYQIKKNHITGGDLDLLFAGSVLRFDFIPNERVKKISPYAIVKPFLMLSSRKTVTANSEEWSRDESTDYTGSTWYYTGTTTSLSNDNWKSKTEFAGGISIGLGVDLVVSSGLSLFLQTGVGFTTPITYVDTGSFNSSLTGYESDDYPFAKKSFIPVTLSIGVSYTY
jgi:hypothetical protein